MTLSKFSHVKISGISAVVPKREICIYDEAQYYGGNIKKLDRMKKIVGIYKRRVCEENTTASDLAMAAGEKLINDMGINKKDIEAIIFVRQRPDVSRPATAFYIHDKMGFDHNAQAFDITLGCTGWMQGLFVAFSMIESKAVKNVLLFAGDIPSLEVKLQDRVSAPIFGDGGSATLIEYSEEEDISYFDSGADGSGFEAIITPASGFRLQFKHPYSENIKENEGLIKPIQTPFGFKTTLCDMFMDGAKVYEFTVNQVPLSIKRLMQYANTEEKDINYLMLHQANKQIVKVIADKTGFSEEKAPYNTFENYGNSSVTSIPIHLNNNFYNKNSIGKVLISAFGSGLAWSSGIFNFKNVYFSGVNDYIEPDDKPKRDDIIKYWQNKIEKTGESI